MYESETNEIERRWKQGSQTFYPKAIEILLARIHWLEEAAQQSVQRTGDSYSVKSSYSCYELAPSKRRCVGHSPLTQTVSRLAEAERYKMSIEVVGTWKKTGHMVVLSQRYMKFDDGDMMSMGPVIERIWHQDYFTEEEWEKAVKAEEERRLTQRALDEKPAGASFIQKLFAAFRK